MQRNVSTPLELHELNIVNKSNNELPMSTTVSSKKGSNKSDPTPTTPRKTQTTSIPMSGPRLNIKTTVISPKKNDLDQLDSEFDEREKLYKLAQKKREISELEMKLVQLKKELKIMEQELKPILNKIHSKAVDAKTNGIKNRGLRGGDTTDNNNNNNNNRDVNRNDEGNYYSSRDNDNDPDSSLTIISQHIPSKFKENKFVKTLLNKFNEFNVNEDEFDNHVRSQNDSHFYLREGYNLGEDELEREAQEEIGFLQKYSKWQNKQTNI